MAKYPDLKSYLQENYMDCLQNADEISKEVALILEAQEAEDEVLLEMRQKRLTAFADTLIYHMDRKHITVDDLVERSGLSDTTIKNYRAGKKNPPIENVMAVCIGEYCTR